MEELALGKVMVDLSANRYLLNLLRMNMTDDVSSKTIENSSFVKNVISLLNVLLLYSEIACQSLILPVSLIIVDVFLIFIV